MNTDVKLLLYTFCMLFLFPGCKEQTDTGIEVDSIRVHGSLDNNLDFHVESVYTTKNKSRGCTKYHWQLGRRVSLRTHESTLISPENNQFDSKVPVEKISLIPDSDCDWQLLEIIFKINTKENIQKASSALHFIASKKGIVEDYPEKIDYLCKFSDVKFSKRKVFVCYINGSSSRNTYWLSDYYIKNGININIKLPQPEA